MTVVRPFRALRYDLKRVDLSKVIVPPYDVVAEDERGTFFERDPHNAIRFELTRDVADEPTADYSDVAKILRAWQQSGVLIRDEAPGYYIMKQRFRSPQGNVLERIGFYGELGLAEYSERQVMPHEQTLEGPKADRLKLLKAVKANLSSVFMLYEDPENVVTPLLESAFGLAGGRLGAATDDGGVEYELARLTDPETLATLQRFMHERSCVIADGHHRYETALEYRRQKRAELGSGAGDAPFESSLAYFANAFAAGSLLLPIHRVIRRVPPPNSEQWLDGLPGWSRRVVSVAATPSAVASQVMDLLADYEGRAAFVADAGDAEVQIFVSEEPLGEKLLVQLIEDQVLRGLFGFSTADIRAGEVRFPKSAERAAQDVREGRGTLALYLNALQPDDVFRVTRAGEVMPQKSTFFYPKIPTGMIFRTHGDDS